MSRASNTFNASVGEAWWINENGNPAGPYDRNTIVSRIRSGQISPETLSCAVAGSEWRPISQMSPFDVEFHLPPPVPPLPPRRSFPQPSSNTSKPAFPNPAEQADAPMIQRAITFQWESMAILMLYAPVPAAIVSPLAFMPVGCGFILNGLLFAQAHRLEAILKRPIPGTQMLRIMFYIASVVFGAMVLFGVGTAFQQMMNPE